MTHFVKYDKLGANASNIQNYRGMHYMKVDDFVVKNLQARRQNNSFKAKVHIIDGFLHADNMEHFAKAALKRANNVSDVSMHYVECNRHDINTKQMSSVEDMLKSLSGSLRRGDFLALPGLASVPILNLTDRIKSVLRKNINLTPQNLKANRNILLEFLNQIYNYKNYHSSEISYLDKNSQDLAYTYGVINEVNKLADKGVNVYIPAGHGADSTIKWLAKSNNCSDDMYRFIAKQSDPDGKIKRLLQEAKERNFYDFNLLSLCKAHIVNIKGRNNRDYLFTAKDGLANDGERGVYNFSPVRNSYGELLGYSYHDESTVEYPYNEFNSNDSISNLCKYVGLQYRDFMPSYNEAKTFKEYIKKGYSTANLPDKLYSLRDVFSPEEIKSRKLDTLGHLINNEQNLIFDTNSRGKIIFQKTNCEGSEKPSVLSMWGSCFSAINALVRDVKKSGNNRQGISHYIREAEQGVRSRDYDSAEYYYNEALDILHPDKSNFNYQSNTINTYEKLYSLLKSRGKDSEAKGVSNMIINLKSHEIANKSVYNPQYMIEQRSIGYYYKDIAIFCEKEGEYYPAKVCRWAAEELGKNSSYGDKIVQRRAEQNQYIGDIYDECH